MPIAYSTKQDNTSRRVWKMMENQDVRDGKSRADAKHDCKQLRKMFQYGGTVVDDVNGRAIYFPPGTPIYQCSAGVAEFAEFVLEGVRGEGVNEFANQIMCERLTGKE